MSQSSNLDEKAIGLFYEFARMEYALKVAGFHHGDGDAKADWTRFAKSNEIMELFARPATDEMSGAVEYIRKHPPKKQIVTDGLLGWTQSPPSTNSDADMILTYIRRIRNNLFHGGKFNGHWFEPERSERLIECARLILENCRSASADISEAYSN